MAEDVHHPIPSPLPRCSSALTSGPGQPWQQFAESGSCCGTLYKKEVKKNGGCSWGGSEDALQECAIGFHDQSARCARDDFFVPPYNSRAPRQKNGLSCG